VSDNSLNYSINQSAKEALYVPTSRVDKYHAKAFIDMFVQRSAKVIAVVLNLAIAYISLGKVRWLSLLSISILTLWVIIVRFAGNRFDNLAREKEGAAIPESETHEPDHRDRSKAVA